MWFAGLLFLSTGAGALENVFLVSDTVAHFERTFGVRGRSTVWFANGTGSTINFYFFNKANVNFRLAEPTPGNRFIDQIQVEPLGGSLTLPQADEYAKFLVDDLSRTGNMACAEVRNDQDGINAFFVHSCRDRANPKTPAVDVSITVQSVGGRNLIFVHFVPEKR